MWTTVALVAALSLAPQQAGPLNLTHVRTTYGVPGVSRTDTKLLPGDQLFIAFDIDGITMDANGRVLYSMSTELTDSKGKPLFKQEPRDQEIIAALGGKSIPAYVQLDIGLDQSPGDYTFKVTVTDRASKRSGTLSRNFTVLPATFGLVRLTTTADAEGRVPTAVFETGGALWVNVGVVGFGRKPGTNDPDMNVELRVLDESGKPTMAKPFTGQINEKAKVPPSARFMPVQFLATLNRPGKFTVELKATCVVCEKTVSLAFPITVVESK
jgi:hypothetical protein